jgi:flagellar assembly factor FliW
MFLRTIYLLDISQINSHVPMIYYEPYYIKKNYTFNTKLNYHFETWKIEHMLHLLWLMLVWLHPTNKKHIV